MLKKIIVDFGICVFIFIIDSISIGSATDSLEPIFNDILTNLDKD